MWEIKSVWSNKVSFIQKHKWRVLALSAGLSAFLIGNQAFADAYTLSGWTVSSFWTAALDIANSLVWVLTQLLPMAIPILVVGFVIWFIMSLIRKKG